MLTVLFLCTANYYRSRLAEEMFNHYVAQQGRSPALRAGSAGIMADFWRDINPGSISPYTLEALQRFGIDLPPAPRAPRQLTPLMICHADRTIALSRQEHHPMIRERFPECLASIEFWEVEDLHLEDALPATDRIHRNVRWLIDQLVASD